MKTSTEIKVDISRLICETLNIQLAELESAKELREIQSVDSINLVRAIASIEDHFDIELDDELVFEVKTLDELVAAVQKLISEG